MRENIEKVRRHEQCQCLTKHIMAESLGDAEALVVCHVVQHELVESHPLFLILFSSKRKEFLFCSVLGEPIKRLVLLGIKQKIELITYYQFILLLLSFKFNHRSHYKGDSTVNARYLKRTFFFLNVKINGNIIRLPIFLHISRLPIHIISSNPS